MVAGFATPSMYPFSRNTFADYDFQCAEVTNHSSIQAPSIFAKVISDVPQHSPTSAAPEDDGKSDCDNLQGIIVYSKHISNSPFIAATEYPSATTANVVTATSGGPTITADYPSLSQSSSGA